MKEINIVFKIILPLILGLFLIAAVSVYSNFFLLEKNISNKADERFEIMSVSLSSIIKQDTNLMLGLIEQLEKDQKTVNYFKNNDRESLFWYLLKTYESYNERYDITHFYIHKPNKQNFLRIHNKEKNSDFIQRETLDNAFDTLKVSSGIEFGISDDLVLRVVIPWIVDNKLIGYIELGKDIEKLTPRLVKFVNVDIVFTIKKELISEENFEKWNRTNIDGNYLMMDNHYIIETTIKNIDEELQNHLDKLTLHADYNHEYVQNRSNKYFIHSSPFYDIHKTEVGKFHILLDTSEEYKFAIELLVKVSLIILVLLSFMIVYYFRFLQKNEKELNAVYQKVQRISMTDGLTNLYNKRHYLNNAPVQLKNCSRSKGYISFILIDVDEFKKYNDFYGHLKGDDVLKQISNTIRNVFKRASECCYRVGGEEFLIVSNDTEINNGYKMAELLRESINDLLIEHKNNNKEKIVTVSIGICTQKADNATTINDLYDNADKALYKSKKNGRNQVTIFNDIT